jgi:hypothetical protein
MRVLDRARVRDGAALRSRPWSPCEAHWHALPDPTRTGSAATVPAVLSRLGRGTAVAGNRRPAALPRGCRRPPATDDGARAPVGAVAAGDPGQERSSSQAADGAGRALRPAGGNPPYRRSPPRLMGAIPDFNQDAGPWRWETPRPGLRSAAVRPPAESRRHRAAQPSSRRSAMTENDAGQRQGPLWRPGSARPAHRGLHQ